MAEDDIVVTGLGATTPLGGDVPTFSTAIHRLYVRLHRFSYIYADHNAPGVSGSILEGLDEILTVSRLGLPAELRRSLACTNIIENMNGTIRRVCRNVKRWQDASMALRWTGAAMREAAKGFRRLKACKHLPALRAALTAHQLEHAPGSVSCSTSEACQAYFNKGRGNSPPRSSRNSRHLRYIRI